MYQNDPAKVLIGEVRLSYVHLIEPRTNKPGDDPKYSVTLLIPKTDFATKADIDASIQAAAQDAVSKVWNGAAPPQLQVPIYDGNGVRQSGEPFGEECGGHWVMSASTSNKPPVAPAPYGYPAPAATPPWGTANGFDPITGQPM